VWACVMGELQVVTNLEKDLGVPDWLSESATGDRSDDPWEQERTWRDGAAHKVRSVISKWLDEEHERKAIILVSVIH
jgi:U3 small nucleolar RNA-associated protein 20